jgi:hypothetical protein
MLHAAPFLIRMLPSPLEDRLVALRMPVTARALTVCGIAPASLTNFLNIQRNKTKR